MVTFGQSHWDNAAAPGVTRGVGRTHPQQSKPSTWMLTVMHKLLFIISHLPPSSH